MCVCVTFAIFDAASIAETCVAAGPVVVAMAMAGVAVLLDPVREITVNGASATNDIGPSPQCTDAITVLSGSLLSVIAAGQPVVAETME